MANLNQLLRGVVAQLVPGDRATFSTVTRKKRRPEQPQQPQPQSALPVRNAGVQQSLQVRSAPPPPPLASATQPAVVPNIRLARPDVQPTLAVRDMGAPRSTPVSLPQDTQAAIRGRQAQSLSRFAGGIYKSFASIPAVPVEAGRSIVADFTRNDRARKAADTRLNADLEASLPGQLARGVAKFGEAAVESPTAVRNVVTGGPVSTNPIINALLNPAQAVYQAAGGRPRPLSAEDQEHMTRGLRALNESYLGPLLGGAEKVITNNIPTAADQAREAGFNPDQGIAATVAQTALGATMALAPLGGLEYSTAVRTLAPSVLASPRRGLQAVNETPLNEAGFAKIPGIPGKGKTPEPKISELGGKRPGNAIQSQIEQALNSGDYTAARNLVAKMPEGDLKAGMQSTLDALAPAAKTPRLAAVQQRMGTAGKGVPKTLPEQYDRYFNLNNAEIVPYDKLVSSKTAAQNVKGGANAPALMAQAAAGKVPKREPIKVTPLEDGRFEILDGNGTYTAVGRYGWKGLPAQVVPPEHVAAARQLVTAAEKVNPKFHAAVKSIAKETGLKYTEGPIKRFDRLLEKGVTNYNGDFSRVNDSVRGTMVLHDPTKLDSIIDAFDRKMGIVRIKNGHDNPGPGYKDVKIIVQSKNGHKGEVILATPEMLAAKNNGGHAIYKELRNASDVSSAQYTALEAKMHKLYADAEAATARRLASSGEISEPSTRTLATGKGAPVSRTEPETRLPSETSRTITSSTSKNRSNGLGITASPSKSTVTQPAKDSNPVSTQKQPKTKTTEVGLNTGRLELTKSRRANLDKATNQVIERMSNEEIQKVAKSAGLSTKTFTDEQLRTRIAEQLNVRRDAVRLQNEAAVARRAGNTQRAAELLKQSAERGRLSRQQGTEAARALQARNIIANELDTPQQRIFKLLDNAGVNPDVYARRFASVDFNDANAVMKAYRELVPAKWHNWLDTVRYNSMLSSPLTHAINMSSNAANVFAVAPIEKTLRGVLDAGGGLFGRERQFAAGEGAAYFKGAVSNVRAGTQRFIDVMAGRKGPTNLDLKDSYIPAAIGGAKGKISTTLSVPMRLLEASDQFFTTLAREGEKAALALRTGKNIKVRGDKTALAEAEAAYRLFRQDTGLKTQGAVLDAIDQVTNGLMRFRNSKNQLLSTAAKFSLPFVKTPMNILKQGVEFSPLGYTTMIGASSKLTQFTRASIGTAVFGLAGAMVGAGDTTWSEPTNPDEKARFRSEGKQPYAIRVGDKWISFAKMPPGVSFPFALTAGIHDAVENKKIGQKRADAILAGVAKWGNFLGDQSYVKNIGDTLATFKGDPEKVAQLFSNYPQQVVPFRAMTGWIARMTDPNDRKLDTDKGYLDQQVQSLMLQYPGLREKVGTRNYQGEPIKANKPVFNAFSPVRVTNDRGVSALDKELDAAKAAREAGGTGLTKAQQNEVTKRIKSVLPAKQRELINSEFYKSMSSADRAKALNRLKSDITAVERKNYQAEHNTGEYSPDYEGKNTKLSARQKALSTGERPSSVYSKKTTANRKPKAAPKKKEKSAARPGRRKTATTARARTRSTRTASGRTARSSAGQRRNYAIAKQRPFKLKLFNTTFKTPSYRPPRPKNISKVPLKKVKAVAV